MEPRSLGCRTDLLVLTLSGARITDRGDHLVVESPSNPSYYWGNLLLFPGPPAQGDHERWRETFARELGDREGIRHETFGWEGVDGEEGHVDPFLQAGFELDRCVVMTTREPTPPPRCGPDAEVRPLASDEDWQAALELDLACNDRIEEEAYRRFAERRLSDLQRLVAAGHARWYGAFREGVLAADLGIVAGGGLGRYQAVQTHPEHRRQGLCTHLVVEAGRDAIRDLGARELVMVAEQGAPAERIYRSVGFAGAEQQLGLCRSPHRVGPTTDS